VGRLVGYVPPELVGWFNCWLGHTKDLKMGLDACPASCTTLMDGCKEIVHVWCCHWFSDSLPM